MAGLELQRRVTSMLTEAGVPWRIEDGAKHHLLVYTSQGIERRMPMSHGGDVKRSTERKTLARIAKICALAHGEQVTIGNENDVVEPEAGPDVSFRLGQLVPFDGEPRVRDLDLAERLGMADPHAIRRLIAKHRETLETWGRISDQDRKLDGAGRPSREHWLNRKQALYIAAKSDTEIAALVTVAIIEVFAAWEAGKLTAKPADAADLSLRIAALTQEIEALKAREVSAPIIVKRNRFVRPSLIRRLVA